MEANQIKRISNERPVNQTNKTDAKQIKLIIKETKKQYKISIYEYQRNKSSAMQIKQMANKLNGWQINRTKTKQIKQTLNK